jgi:hypothetical protein
MFFTSRLDRRNTGGRLPGVPVQNPVRHSRITELRSYTALAFASLPDSRPAENQIDGRACRRDFMHEFERMWYAGKADSADVVGPQETVSGKAGVIFGVAYVGRVAVLQNRARPGTLGGGTLRL